jgi:hypothetical protein
MGSDSRAGQLLHTAVRRLSDRHRVRSLTPILSSDSVRYRYKHSILKTGSGDGMHTLLGQRLSIMIRVGSLHFYLLRLISFQDMPNAAGV